MFTIVIQAGGQSSRMGKDKGILPFLGIPLVERLTRRFAELTDNILIISNNSAAYQDFGVQVFQDILPDRGSLGGLYTALSVANTPLVGLIAVDMPFASPELIQYLAARMDASKSDAVIPSTSHGLEPMHAVYRRESCLPHIKKALDQDQWKMIAWYGDANVTVLSPIETRKISGSEHTFHNLNTPKDFAAAEQIAIDLDLV
jgi:molybdopterin-guanine dinucleotide biosynthesis protein A